MCGNKSDVAIRMIYKRRIESEYIILEDKIIILTG